MKSATRDKSTNRQAGEIKYLSATPPSHGQQTAAIISSHKPFLICHQQPLKGKERTVNVPVVIDFHLFNNFISSQTTIAVSCVRVHTTYPSVALEGERREGKSRRRVANFHGTELIRKILMRKSWQEGMRK